MNATVTADRHDEMLRKIEQGKGFIAALDQSGGSTPKALKGYGIEEGAWSNDEEMFGLIHQMRSRIITAPSFGSGKVLGAFPFERNLDGAAAGTPEPAGIWRRAVVPVVIVERGTAVGGGGGVLLASWPGRA